jgi:hypothetical protein
VRRWWGGASSTKRACEPLRAPRVGFRRPHGAGVSSRV